MVLCFMSHHYSPYVYMQMCLGMLINLLFCFFAEYMAHMIYLLCVSIYIYIKITWACISYVCVCLHFMAVALSWLIINDSKMIGQNCEILQVWKCYSTRSISWFSSLRELLWWSMIIPQVIRYSLWLCYYRMFYWYWILQIWASEK